MNRVTCYSLIFVFSSSNALAAANDWKINPEFRSPQSMIKGRELAQAVGLPTDVWDRGQYYFLSKNQSGKWIIQRKASLQEANTEMIWVDPSNKTIYLAADLVGPNRSWPYCSSYGPQAAGPRMDYTVCNSQFTKSTQTSPDGRYFMTVNEPSIMAAITEAGLDAFLKEGEIQKSDAVVIPFRKKLKPGDETNIGMVIEVKPPLAKIQTSNINAGERWYRIEELYPRP